MIIVKVTRHDVEGPTFIYYGTVWIEVDPVKTRIEGYCIDDIGNEFQTIDVFWTPEVESITGTDDKQKETRGTDGRQIF